jgi:hypothetical protein
MFETISVNIQEGAQNNAQQEHHGRSRGPPLAIININCPWNANGFKG